MYRSADYLFIYSLFLICLFAIPSLGIDKETETARKVFDTGETKNLIKNPSFTEGTTHWMLGKFDGGAGKFRVDTATTHLDGSAAQVTTFNNADQSISSIQLLTVCRLEANVRYSIMFRAAVDKATLISVGFRYGEDVYFEETVLLKPSQTTYGPFNFRCDVDEPMAQFTFNLGKTSGKLFFDDVLVLVDNSEKMFNEIIAKSGVNIHQTEGRKELFIQLPYTAVDDIPVLIFGPNGNLLKSTRITRGIRETSVDLSKYTQTGKYQVKVLTPLRTMACLVDVK